VPVTTASTSASAAICLRSSAPSAYRAAARLERTTSVSSLLSDVVIASARQRQPVDLWIGAQHAKRQDDQSDGGLGVGDLAGVGDRHGLAQRARHLGGITESLVRMLRQRAAEDPIEGRNRGRAGQHRRLLVHDRMKDVDRRRARERRTPGERLEENRAEREHVGPAVGRVAGDLLGRHVVRCADDDAREREAGLAGRVEADRFARQAEVEQLHAARREKDVRRFQVPVHEAGGVEGAERLENRQGDRRRFGDRHRAAKQASGQRLALEELHRDEQLPVGLADFVQPADVRVGQLCRGAGFPQQALAGERIGGPHHLDRDRTIEPIIVRRVHDAHASLAERSEHAVAADGRWNGHSLDCATIGAPCLLAPIASRGGCASVSRPAPRAGSSWVSAAAWTRRSSPGSRRPPPATKWSAS
jgi:hypothetical protein